MPFALQVITLLTLLKAGLTSSSNATSCHPQCFCPNSTTVDCSNKGLTSLPSNLPRNLTLLLLIGNQLQTLSPHVLLQLPLLKKIDLSNNRINCNCSLSWIQNSSIDVQVIGVCDSPTAVRGRAIGGLKANEMCRRPSFLIRPSNISLTEGKNGMLDCKVNVNGPRSVLWRYHNGVDSELDTSHFMVLDNGTLLIINVQMNHTGIYVCIITSAQQKRALANVDVQEISAQSVPTVMLTTNHAMPPTTASERLTTTPKAQTSTPKIPSTTPKALSTTPKARSTTAEVRLTTNEAGSTIAGARSTTAKARSTTAETRSTTAETRSTTAETLSTRPEETRLTTSRPNLNLANLVKESNGTQLSAVALRKLVKSLEDDVYVQKSTDRNKTTHYLHVVSNLIRKQNSEAWTKVNQSGSVVERLLKIVNKAVELQAMDMLKNDADRTERFSAFDNLDAEIQVVEASAVAGDGVTFPSLKSREDDYIKFPALAFKKAGKQKIALIGIIFNQLEELLPRRSVITNFDSFQTNSRVISGSIITSNGSLQAPVTIKFKNKNNEDAGRENTKCVFWSYDKTVQNVDSRNHGETSSSPESGWSDEGCNLSSSNATSTVCRCSHLTDFAVLTKSDKDIAKPSVVFYVGSLILFVAAGIAFFRNIIIWRETRRERLFVLTNQCLAIILAVMVILLGVFLDYQKTMCIAFSSLLHWFVLALFCWILMEGIQLYLSVHVGWSRNSTRLKYLLLFGWIAPLIVAAMVLVITRDDAYESSQWCWYNRSVILFLTYICPVALLILVCVIVMLKTASLKSIITDDNDKKDISVILTSSGFLIPLVTAWCVTTALSANHPEKDVIQYIFAVLCILLGIYLVIYHCFLDREITKTSIRQNNKRSRAKRDYYSTKETVMYSEGTSEGKSFSLIFPSRKSPEKKAKGDGKRSAKKSDSGSHLDYDSTVPMYPSINDSSLKSFRSQVSTQQHTLESPPNTLSAITISRPNSQCIELTSLSDLDRRPDGAEQTDSGEHSEFYGARNSNPVDKVRQRTSGSSDCANATTFGKDTGKPVQGSSNVPANAEVKNRVSGASSAGVSGTSRSSVSGASVGAAEAGDLGHHHDDTFEGQPFLGPECDRGPEVKSDPPAKIPKRRKRGSRRRLDEEFLEEETAEDKIKPRQNSSSLPASEGSVLLKHYTSF